ncbi:hypothetical protein BO71DRAFT_67798 [Aspergillus ellipticus CBS 707.79]|uniref:Uncharacterized protein n=1 Tax=Aspergillus ellipticus CBS 707.79 TaxID=1448320 RepID=A0A319D1A5_9EURO|nr:hypothetical protein BO71DRAFT_67798 [Aspergillus ellipticus CBS 707.79]
MCHGSICFFPSFQLSQFCIYALSMVPRTEIQSGMTRLGFPVPASGWAYSSIFLRFWPGRRGVCGGVCAGSFGGGGFCVMPIDPLLTGGWSPVASISFYVLLLIVIVQISGRATLGLWMTSLSSIFPFGGSCIMYILEFHCNKSRPWIRGRPSYRINQRVHSRWWDRPLQYRSQARAFVSRTNPRRVADFPKPNPP